MFKHKAYQPQQNSAEPFIDFLPPETRYNLSLFGSQPDIAEIHSRCMPSCLAPKKAKIGKILQKYAEVGDCGWQVGNPTPCW